jgi:hypothetical protein
MKSRCKYCEDGYVKKNGVYTPCQHCITPERFEKTLDKAIASCGPDYFRKKTLSNIKDNLPDYPIMALLEAEHYGQFSKDFMRMLKSAYDIKPFMDVKYKKYKG